MGVGVMKSDPITAMRAVLRIEEAEVVASNYRDDKGREQKQFACTLKALSGTGDRDGETFNEWLSFLATGVIGKKTRTGQVLTATLGEDARAETLDELAEKLVGKTFAAQIGTSKNGEYPRIVHDTIGPATGEDNANGPASGADRDEEGPEEDFDAIPS